MQTAFNDIGSDPRMAAGLSSQVHEAEPAPKSIILLFSGVKTCSVGGDLRTTTICQGGRPRLTHFLFSRHTTAPELTTAPLPTTASPEPLIFPGVPSPSLTLQLHVPGFPTHLLCSRKAYKPYFPLPLPPRRHRPSSLQTTPWVIAFSPLSTSCLWPCMWHPSGCRVVTSLPRSLGCTPTR